MNLEALLAVVLPVIIYVVLEKRKGLKVAIISSLVTATVLVVYFVVRFEINDRFLWLEYALLLLLGLVTLRLQNAKFFKFQPTIVGTIMGAYILVIHFVDQPIMIRMLPIMEKMVDDPAVLEMIRTPHMQRVLTQCSWMMGCVFLCHAAVNGVVALRYSSQAWMWVRLAIYPAMVVVMFVAQLTA